VPRKEVIIENVQLGKLVHGGQAMGQTDVGKKILVWGGLPGETVDVRVTKKKSSYLEGIVNKVNYSSNDRIEPEEPLSYLSTSPWQFMTYEAENNAKQSILSETFEREGITGVDWSEFKFDEKQYGYRNKMEMGFWGDDDGLHLAHYVRGTHGKQKVDGSALAGQGINEAARAVRDELSRLEVWGGKLKTVLLRANSAGDVAGALFVKEELDFKEFQLPAELKGLDIYYSNPKSPASVPTKKLVSLGTTKMSDTIAGNQMEYDVLSFFQVNIPIFESALEVIKANVSGVDTIDMYSGVGAIGISVGARTLVESEASNIAMAKNNSKDLDIDVIHAESESALEHITPVSELIVDPPRAGLHKAVIDRINEVKPSKIIYLSCNPSTQSRDVKLLENHYNISYAQGFNFFPRTPHIESLIVMDLK